MYQRYKPLREKHIRVGKSYFRHVDDMHANGLHRVALQCRPTRKIL